MEIYFVGTGREIKCTIVKQLSRKEYHFNWWYKIEFGTGIINSIRKFFRDEIYIDADDIWGRGTAHQWISSGFRYRANTEQDKIEWILYCMNCDDSVMRYAIHIVVKEEFPQYKKVLDEPDRYRILI